MDALWPDSFVNDATNSLYKNLHFARRILGCSQIGTPAISLINQILHLVPDDRISLDVETFDRLASEALATPSIARIEAAVSAYGGELLPDDPYEDWIVEHRERLKNTYRLLLIEASRQCEEHGQTTRSIAYAQKVLELDPWDEESHQRLIRAHARAGNTAAALRQFDACQQVLSKGLAIEPSRETQRLAAAVKEGLFPAEPAFTDFQRFFRSSSELYCSVAPDLTIRTTNPEFARRMGLDAAEAATLSLLDLIAPKDRPRIRNVVASQSAARCDDDDHPAEVSALMRSPAEGGALLVKWRIFGDGISRGVWLLGTPIPHSRRDSSLVL